MPWGDQAACVSYLTAEAGSVCLLPEEDYLQWQTEAVPWLLVAGSVEIANNIEIKNFLKFQELCNTPNPPILTYLWRKKIWFFRSRQDWRKTKFKQHFCSPNDQQNKAWNMSNYRVLFANRMDSSTVAHIAGINSRVCFPALKKILEWSVQIP